MEKYILKSALVAEIERRYAEHDADYNNGDETELHRMVEDRAIIEYINTIEVKEVDINKEISQFIDANFEKATIGHKLSLRRVAKHFFELGMSVRNKAQKGKEV